MPPAVNGDLSVPVAMDTTTMEWTPSPSGSVWRKRVHLVGEPESGQVTSVVRYDARATFPAHDHPDGEEILVLEGVFSDEHGDWPAGTYLLNPEGFRHAPFSEHGCVLFVKLRQYAGAERRHVVVDTRALPWQATTTAGVSEKILYTQAGFSDHVAIERWDAHARRTSVYPLGAELFVLEGELDDASGSHHAGCWLRLPAGSRHDACSAHGCTFYIKRSGLACLKCAVA